MTMKIIWSNILDVKLLFLYYYFHHQHQDHRSMNIHRNWQYQISYRYRPSVAQQSTNHRPLSFEQFHRVDEFSMVDIDFCIRHDPNRIEIEEKRKKRNKSIVLSIVVDWIFYSWFEWIIIQCSWWIQPITAWWMVSIVNK